VPVVAGALVAAAATAALFLRRRRPATWAGMGLVFE
jgi:hypothetical protein